MLPYAVKEALSTIRRTKLTSLAATSILAVCLFLVGLFLMAYVNMTGVAAKIRERVQIEAFLSDDVSWSGALALADSIRAFWPVKAISYLDKEKALEAFRQQFGDEALQVLETNPLPASLKIELQERDRTFPQAQRISKRIEDLPGVVDVEYGGRWLSRLDRLLSAVGAATLILGAILGGSSVFVVATTIKLTFHARREAVEIMQLVGATRGVVARPFLVEGAVYGFLGALFGLILLVLLYSALSSRVAGLLFLSPNLLVGLLAFGTLLGLLGSSISLRKMV
jgi:cell division transport system permease protein